MYSCSHQHFRLVYFFSDLIDAGLLAVLYGEVTRASCDLEQEGAQHLHASLRQVDFRVKLRPIQLLLFVSNPWWRKCVMRDKFKAKLVQIKTFC